MSRQQNDIQVIQPVRELKRRANHMSSYCPCASFAIEIFWRGAKGTITVSVTPKVCITRKNESISYVRMLNAALIVYCF